jgi:tRNA threonylcarbamoyladenosine biosynthesis protein TsaE
MSTDVTWQIESTSSEQTEQLGQRLGKALKGGEVIELVSDLGGGKTTFVRGLAAGANSADKVASPTFTINKVYKTDNFEIQHFDFYRLPEPGIVAVELAEVVGDPTIVTVIEWADVVQNVLPKTRLTVDIKQTPQGTRAITFLAPAELSFLIEALQ